MKFEHRLRVLHTFVSVHHRFPSRAGMEEEKSLAYWVEQMKRRARYARGTTPLTQREHDLLAVVPGWTPSRWHRSSTTGTRRIRQGYQARLKVNRTLHYGPYRTTRTLARSDYEHLRTAADEGMETFQYVLTHLNA